MHHWLLVFERSRFALAHLAAAQSLWGLFSERSPKHLTGAISLEICRYFISRTTDVPPGIAHSIRLMAPGRKSCTVETTAARSCRRCIGSAKDLVPLPQTGGTHPIVQRDLPLGDQKQARTG